MSAFFLRCVLADWFGLVIVTSASVGWEYADVKTTVILPGGREEVGVVVLKPTAAFLLRPAIGLSDL